MEASGALDVPGLLPYILGKFSHGQCHRAVPGRAKSARSTGPLLGLGLLATSLLASSPAPARDVNTPDWPCVQRKVDNITSAQVWGGPAVDGMTEWRDEPGIAALATRLADRRVALEEAEKTIAVFAVRQPQPVRAQRLTLLFAGLFETLQQQRRSVIARLEAYRRAQGERALELERQGLGIAELEDKAATEPNTSVELREAKDRFDIAQRIFQERQDSIPFACEIPVRIDARIFTLGKAIHDLMPAAAASMAPAPQ
jgi:hypothetical protein